MIILKSVDTSDTSTATSSITKALFMAEDYARQEYERLSQRRQYMMSFLRDFKEVPLEVWDAMLAHFDHSNNTPDEIYDIGKKMMEVRKNDAISN